MTTAVCEKHKSEVRERIAARISRIKADGLCIHNDGMPAAPGRIICKQCIVRGRELVKARRAHMMARGLCVHDGMPAVPGYTLCKYCMAKAKERRDR